MANFITRVELHNALWVDYETLHTEMAKEGFTRTIVSGQGVRYNLPTAEYYITGLYSTQQVLTMACNAAVRTGKQYSVIASETSNSAWQNLTVSKS
jgi:hypothetical protein